MNDKLIHDHRAKIMKSYLRRIANLTKLDRMADCADTAYKMAGILMLWSVQDEKAREAAEKGLERVK
jgi:hypothetical protein